MIKKVGTILGVIIALGTILGAGWSFYDCKADKTELVKLQSAFNVYQLEQQRRYLQQRIWELQRQFPQTYMNMVEYHRLVNELKAIDQQINAYYQRKGS